MYEAYFHFQSPPFPATPVVPNYFPAESIESARESLVRLIERAEGPGLVVGQAGLGKSLLLRLLAEYFASRFRVVLLAGARIATRKTLLQYILFELGLPFRGMDEGELRLALVDTLRPSDVSPMGILVLADEAHTLPLHLLDELRMITNVVRDGQPRARLVLAGDPRIEERFASPKLESFNQRIAARCYLRPFTRDETFEYVRAELSWAGGDPDAIFSEEAIRAVYHATDGIPRLVNQVCDHALVMAHAAGIRRLDEALIQTAWSDLQQLPPPWQAPATGVPSGNSTVIEFGQLEDLPSTEPRNGGAVPAKTRESLHAYNEPPEDEAHPWTARGAETSDLDHEAAQQESAIGPAPDSSPDAFVNAGPAFGYPAEWIDCGGQAWGNCDVPSQIQELQAAESKAAELPTPEPQAGNPFGDGFEEEVIVIDREAVNEAEAFRGRPRVALPEGCDLAEELKWHFRRPESPTASHDFSTPARAHASGADTAFEFTTMTTPLPARDVYETLHADSGIPADAHAREADDEVRSVPLPWTRGSLGDDRDLIVVEDDPLELGSARMSESSGERATQVEYRELFAQLRRTTP